jgi:hypothetical protein
MAGTENRDLRLARAGADTLRRRLAWRERRVGDEPDVLGMRVDDYMTSR